jgi:prepilin-type N-terminal cleavage/methylation domain-containing protein
MRLSSKAGHWKRRKGSQGFSLIEMLVSILIIVLLMSAVFPFLFQAQKRFQGNVVISEANQSARAALEVMSQEIGQAGYNPQFYPNKTSTTSVTTNGCNQPIQISDPTGINPGDWVSVDTGANQELVEVFATTASATVTTPAATCANPPNGCTGTCTFPSGNWIAAKFLMNHTTTPYSISSYKMPYAAGILVSYSTTGQFMYAPDCTSNLTNCAANPQSYALSNDQRLEFYGDINQDGTINYVVYSISPMVPTQTVCIPAVASGTPCPAANTYTLYNLYRSIQAVPFPTLPQPPTPTSPVYVPACPGVSCNSQASPMVEKVLYHSSASVTAPGSAGYGPTGQPIFNFADHQQIGTAPNVYTALGTVVVTLCVAVNPQAMETGTVQWYSMATQIRPLNLNAAINVNNSNGGLYLAPTPKSLPMAIPASPPYYP